MATPTWNQIAAPNFSAGNDLIAQAMNQLTKATTGFKSIADQYKDTVQKRNLGLIQEYVNSAKTPEELQSEAFQTGLTKLTGNMGGDYDTLAKAQLVDKAYDSLLSRKANQVSIASNEFNLDTAKKTQLTKDYTNKILAAPPEQRDALRQAAIDAGAFDFSGVTAGDLAVAQLLGTTQQNKLRDATWDDQVKAFKLANNKTQADIDDIKTNNDIAWYNALTQRAQAEAAAEKARQEKENTKNGYIATGAAAIDAAKQKVIEQVYGSGLNTDGSKTLGEWVRLKKEEGNDPLPEYIQYLITSHPKLKSQPENIQSLYATKVYNEFSDRRALYNPVGWMTDANKEKVQSLLTNVVQDFEQQVKTAEVNATAPLYKKLVLEHAQKTGAKSTYAAAQDLGLDELTIYKSGIPSPLAAEAKIKYASSDKSIPESQFIENEINIATNPDYATSNAPLFPKQEAANVPAQSSRTFLNALGRGSSAEKVALINEQMKQTDDPMQIAFLENELKKAVQSEPVKQATTTTTSPQNKTGTSLQQAALPPNVNKLISTPLGIVTNPSTLKTKPVADLLRQAALEQTPVATSNTAQPRPLTPTEAAQGEGMEQAALSGLIGAKLEEKQALVRKVFPNASLSTINKATEPLSNNSIPLIQSMFKLPVITDTPKAITTEAKQIKQSVFTDTSLKVLANAVKPVPSPLVPVESQNAFKSRDNNLSINLSTGKSVPSKDPVPMPNVSWGKPAEVVTMNPMVAKLPQYKVVATFVGDGDTFSAKSDSYATKGEKAKKAGGILCRVDSVDAPETEHKGYGSFKGKLGQPYGEEAGKKLRDMILNKEISIRIVRASNGDPNEPGLYGRDICQIEVKGVNVSTELIRAGAAWLYREYNYYFTGLETVEANAKAEGRGLFSDPNAVYPPTAKHNGSLNLR